MVFYSLLDVGVNLTPLVGEVVQIFSHSDLKSSRTKAMSGEKPEEKALATLQAYRRKPLEMP